jgi:hypothetical protein
VNTSYEIVINNPNGLASGDTQFTIDGKLMDENFIQLIDDKITHYVLIELIELEVSEGLVGENKDGVELVRLL